MGFEEIEAQSTLRGGASFPPRLLNRNSFLSTQGSKENPPKYHHDDSHILEQTRQYDIFMAVGPFGRRTETCRS